MREMRRGNNDAAEYHFGALPVLRRGYGFRGEVLTPDPPGSSVAVQDYAEAGIRRFPQMDRRALVRSRRSEAIRAIRQQARWRVHSILDLRQRDKQFLYRGSRRSLLHVRDLYDNREWANGHAHTTGPAHELDVRQRGGVQQLRRHPDRCQQILA